MKLACWAGAPVALLPLLLLVCLLQGMPALAASFCASQLPPSQEQVEGLRNLELAKIETLISYMGYTVTGYRDYHEVVPLLRNRSNSLSGADSLEPPEGLYGHLAVRGTITPSSRDNIYKVHGAVLTLHASDIRLTAVAGHLYASSREQQLCAPQDLVQSRILHLCLELCSHPLGTEAEDCKIGLSMTFPFPLLIHDIQQQPWGNLESLRSNDDPLHFSPLLFSMDMGAWSGSLDFGGEPWSAYQYSLQRNVVMQDACLREDPTGFEGYFYLHGIFHLAENNCRTGNGSYSECGPFSGVDRSTMLLRPVSLEATRGNVDREVLGKRQAFVRAVFDSTPAPVGDIFAPKGFWLAAEGIQSNRICMLACFHQASRDCSDCQVKVTAKQLDSPVATLLTLGVSALEVSSLREPHDPLYFNTLTLLASSHADWDRQWTPFVDRYEYDPNFFHLAASLCDATVKSMWKAGAEFPSGVRDLSFNGLAWDSENQSDIRHLCDRKGMVVVAVASVGGVETQVLQVSFRLYGTWPNTSLHMGADMRLQIGAEGQYDTANGRLCLVGCRFVLDLELLAGERISGVEGMGRKDCQISITIQYPPKLWSAIAQVAVGSIRSLRNASDPLYFHPLSLIHRVYYDGQDRGFYLPPEMEVVLTLAGLSATLLFTWRQLRHSQRHPASLPYLSLTMLTSLCICHAISLVTDLLNGLPRDGSVIEDVQLVSVVGVLTAFLRLIVLLALLRLLWLAGSARLKNQESNPQERIVAFLCLGLFLALVLPASFTFHGRVGIEDRDEQEETWLTEDLWRLMMFLRSLWWHPETVLRRILRLVLDLFLLPQAIANAVWDTSSGTNPLSIAFYLGLTLVRCLFGVLEAYRSTDDFFLIPLHYYYGLPEFRAGWPLAALVLGTVVHLQQRWGGKLKTTKNLL